MQHHQRDEDHQLNLHRPREVLADLLRVQREERRHAHPSMNAAIATVTGVIGSRLGSREITSPINVAIATM
jgi:hypothetical protein